MTRPKRREADGQTHHPPKSVEQQSEDSFPTSDPPSYSGGNVIGAPQERKTKTQKDEAERLREAEKKVKSGESRKPDSY